MRSKSAVLAEVENLLSPSQPFSKEAASRVESLLAYSTHLPDDADSKRRPLESLRVNPEFRAFLVQGKSALDYKRRNELEKQQIQALGHADTGAYIVPADFFQTFETVLKETDHLFDVGTRFESATGTAVGFPLLDDVGSAAAVVAENQTSTEADLIFGNLAFPTCPTWRSGQVRASWEFQGDQAFNFEAMLAAAFAKRIARGAGADFVGKLVTAAGAGVTAAATNAVVGDELYSLVDALDESYLPNASFCMKRSTLTAIWKLKGSGSGNYLFEPEFDANGRPMLLGFRVVLCPSMPAMAASQKSITFGDHSRFVIRVVRNGTVIISSPERYAEYGEGSWQMLARIDGGLLVGSVNPVVCLQQHS